METVKKKQNFVLVMIIYLAGIFMGAIDTGIVTPARTIIQNSLGVDPTAGIWMFTIYTLAYAVSIPIMGKLADMYGRKYVYLISILLFGLGSLFCGLSQQFGGFSMLLIARAVQAIGGGGILPVATAEFGTTFPPEKRGVALGLVGGVYGIANIFGASAGSAIIDIFGKNNWQFLFFINLPITLFIILAGLLRLPNTKVGKTTKIDSLGILTLSVMILSLLYGLKNLDFFDFGGTIGTTGVYLFLILFAILIPVFILVEKRAQAPVMNLKYFSNRNIVFTLLISFVSGFVMMGMIFIPQFSENALKITTGSGGYLVIILGVFAGIGAPVSGKLIDKFGAKVVLGFGFAVSIAGALFLTLVTTAYPGLATVLVSLALIGTGMGFTIGTPLNYMMLANTKESESNSALATLSLVRSIGTAIAPAIMVGFIAHAGAALQTDVMNLLPKQVSLPELPYAQEITDAFNKMKADPNMQEKLSGMEMPDLASMTTMDINMGSGSGFTMPSDLLELMQSSDVTTITQNAKTLASRMFDIMTPDVIKKIQDGIGQGITGIGKGAGELKEAVLKMQEGYDGIGKGIEGMSAAIKGQKSGLAQLQTISDMLKKQGITEIPENQSIADLVPAFARLMIPKEALDELTKIKTIDDLNAKISELDAAITTLETKVAESEKNRADMKAAMEQMTATALQMEDLQSKMGVLKDAIPTAFKQAEENYLAAIGQEASELENTFQATMNGGFSNVYLTAAIAALIALLMLVFYKNPAILSQKNSSHVTY
jgi:EmrB/QacA subfamily drug resistance transporter